FAYASAPVAEYVLNAGNWSGNLEASLRSRLELFGEELARAADPEERELLERLAFNLRLHLRIAALRGMASRPPKVGWRPRRIGWGVAHVWAWTFRRFARQLRLSN